MLDWGSAPGVGVSKLMLTAGRTSKLLVASPSQRPVDSLLHPTSPHLTATHTHPTSRHLPPTHTSLSPLPPTWHPPSSTSIAPNTPASAGMLARAAPASLLLSSPTHCPAALLLCISQACLTTSRTLIVYHPPHHRTVLFYLEGCALFGSVPCEGSHLPLPHAPRC